MTVTFRRSQAGRRQRQRAKRLLPITEDDPGHQHRSEATPPAEFFTPATPEPYPLYSFIEDWNRGIIPANPTLLKFLDSWASSPILANDPRLSPAGTGLVTDLKELGIVLARIIRERNKDELFQRFIGHLRLAGRVIGRGPRSGRVTVVEDLPRRRRVKLFGRKDVQIRSEVATRRQTVRQDAHDLFDMAQLLITSTDFRGIIMGIQKIAWRAINQCPVVAKVVETSRPVVGITEDAGSASGGGAVAAGTLTGKLAESLHSRIERTACDIKDPQQHHPSQYSATLAPTITVYEPRASGSRPPQSAKAAEPKTATVAATTTTTTTTATTATAATPPAATDTATTPHLNTSERDAEVEALLNDMRSLFKRLAGNPEFRSAISGIWSILTRWQSQASRLPGTVLSSDLAYDANFAAAQQDLLTLVERFAGGKSLRPLLDSTRKFQLEATNDYELSDFFLDWKSFLTACTGDEAYLDHDEYRRRGRFLLDRTNAYAEKRYRRLFQENLASWEEFLRGWRNDKLTSEVGRIFAHIVNQDLTGASGRASGGGRGVGGLLNLGGIQTSLLADLRDVILPAVLRALYELPLPHMEIEQGSMKISLDNVVLPAALFAPVALDLNTHTALHVTPRQRLLAGITRRSPRSSHPRWASATRLSVAGMKGDIPNIRFALHRPTFPRIRDQGTCDVRLGGRGLSLQLDLATDINAAKQRFHLEPLFVRVRLDRLSLRFYDVKNETFFTFVRPYLQWVLKSRMERMLCQRIVETVYFVDRLASRLAKNASMITG